MKNKAWIGNVVTIVFLKKTHLGIDGSVTYGLSIRPKVFGIVTRQCPMSFFKLLFKCILLLWLKTLIDTCIWKLKILHQTKGYRYAKIHIVCIYVHYYVHIYNIIILKVHICWHGFFIEYILLLGTSFNPLLTYIRYIHII